jgi:8-oxo-dGTP diphosphatase
VTGPTRPELCVGAVVLRRDELLLVRRGRGPAAGEWSVPGGRVEAGETLAEAVVREVAEETGLEVICGEALGWVERIDEVHHFVILDFLAVPVDPASPLTAGDDASEAAWVPRSDATGLNLVDGLAEFLAEHGILDVIV